MEKAKRIDSLDLLKTIAIFMVIAQHIPLFEYDIFTNNNLSSYLQYLFKLISEGVPLFLAINGFLLLKKDNIDVKKHYKKTILIFMLLCIWSIILIVINLLFDGTPINRSVIIDLFLKTGSDGSLYTSELWFLQYLIAIYLLYPIIWEIYHTNYDLFKILFIIICIFTIGTGSISMASELITNQHHSDVINNLSIFLNKTQPLGECKWYFLYFCLGGIINKNYDTINKNKVKVIFVGLFSWILSFMYGILVCISKNALYAPTYNTRTIFMVFIILMWFALFNKYENKNKVTNLITYIGSNTLGIYVTHSYFLRIARLILPSSTFIFRIGILLLTFLFSYLFTYIIKKVPFLNRLVKFM